MKSFTPTTHTLTRTRTSLDELNDADDFHNADDADDLDDHDHIDDVVVRA